MKWDSAEEAAICPERVSPWSIDLIEIYKRKRKSIPPDSKKPQPVNPLFPFSVKDGKHDNGFISGIPPSLSLSLSLFSCLELFGCA